MYPCFGICSSEPFQFGYLHAWSSIPFWYPDLLNFNPSILALSLYCILLLFMMNSWVFLLETGITATLFNWFYILFYIGVVFFTFLWFWGWVFGCIVPSFSPYLLWWSGWHHQQTLMLGCLVLVLVCHWYIESRVLILVLILVVLHFLKLNADPS